MKKLALFTILMLSGCVGGDSQEDPEWVKAYDECISLENEGISVVAKISTVEDENGDTYFEVECQIWDVL